MSTSDSVNQYVAIMVIVLVAISIIIVKFYGEPGFPLHTSFTVVICYFCAFGILLIIPADIASVIVERNSKSSDEGGYYNVIQILSVFYNTLFVTILVMGSVVLVFQEYYNTDGYFTFRGRVASAFSRMMIPNIAGLIVGSIVLGILIKQNVVKQDISAIELTAIIITNIVYETFLMFLMGYGLIELPRSVWLQGSLSASLLRAQMKACADFSDISEAQTSMGLCVASVIKTRNEKAASFAKDPKLTNAMNILSAECPPEFRSSRNGETAMNKQGKVTISILATLRTQLNENKDRYRTAQTKIEATKKTAYRLMDLEEAWKKSAQDGTKSIHWSLTNTESTVWEYYWHLYYSPILLRALSVVLGILSLFSFLGVISTMTGVSNSSSVYFQAVHRGTPSFSGVLIFILVTMGYAVYVTLWALFQMQFAGMMHLVPHRTSAVCLSFNARMCARLAAPMAFFYLGWLAESGIKSGDWLYREEPSSIGYHNVTVIIAANSTSTNRNSTTISIVEPYVIDNNILMRSAFSHFYQMDTIGIFKQFFATVFPIMLIVVMALVLTNVLNFLLVKCKLDYLQMGTLFVNKEQLEEGKRKLERYRKTTERATQRSALKNKLLGMFSSEGADGMSPLGKFFFILFGGTFGTKGDTSDPGASAERTKQQRAAAQSAVGDSDGKHFNELLRRQPKEITGTVERKKNGMLGISNSWKQFRAVVMPPGVIVFSAMDTAQSSSASTVDLSLVVNFTIPRSEEKVNTKLVLEMSDEIIRLRFRSVQDLEEWCESLKLWKEYAIDFGNYTQGEEYNQLGARLDELKIEVDDDVEEGGGGTYISAVRKSRSADPDFMLDSQNTRDTGYVPPTIALPRSSYTDQKPNGITEGWLEKKRSSKIFSMGPEWQKRYCRIDTKTRCLMYGKTPSMSHDSSAATSIDLTMVTDILNEDANGTSDSTRVTLVGVGGGSSSLKDDMSEDGTDKNAPIASKQGTKAKVVQFRAVSAEEGEKWVASMNEWRDYFLLQYAGSQGI